MLNNHFRSYKDAPCDETFAVLLIETDRDFVGYSRKSGLSKINAHTLAAETSRDFLFKEETKDKPRLPQEIQEEIEDAKKINDYEELAKRKIRSAVITSKKKKPVINIEVVNPKDILYETPEQGINLDSYPKQEDVEVDFIIDNYTANQLYNILLIFQLWYNCITDKSLENGADIEEIKRQIRSDIYEIKNINASNFDNQIKRIRDDKKAYKISFKMLGNWKVNNGLFAKDTEKFHNYAKNLQRKKQFSIAKGIWQALIQVTDEKSKLYQNIRSNIALTEKRMGNNKASFDEYSAIIAKIQERMEYEDTYPWATNMNLARMYNQLGVIRMLERNYDAALLNFKSAYQCNQKDYSYVYNIFEVLLVWKQAKGELSEFVTQKISEKQLDLFQNYVERQIQKLEDVNHPTNTYYYILNFIGQSKKLVL